MADSLEYTVDTVIPGIQGPTGPQGATGATGTTPNISAAATTLAAGSQATVTKTGTTEAPTFTFGIPKGDTGDVTPAATAAKEAAESARDAAVTAKNAAVTAKEDAETAKSGADSAKADAVTAKNAAVTAKDDAVTAKEAAVTAKTDAVAAKEAAVTAKDDAVTAKTAAVTAKDDAVTAKTAAVTAQGAAETAQAAAESARDAAVTAKNTAVSAKDDAEDARGAAVVAKADAVAAQTAAETAETGAETAQSAAETARDAAITAKNAAVTAQSAAETAKTGAETAKTGAETARDTAAGSATAASNSATAAANSATAAASSATAAEESAEAAEAAAATFTEATEAQVSGMTTTNYVSARRLSAFKNLMETSSGLSKRVRTFRVAMGYEAGKEWTVSDLSTAVQASNFDEIAIGDYFKVSFTTDYGTVTNEKVLVAGINYFKNCGDTATTSPHLVMIPANGFGNAAMNETHTTVGAYVGSAMHTTVLPAIAEALKTVIGSSHVVAQRRLLSTTMTASTASMAGAGFMGASTSWTWTECDLCLMSEPMVYGGTILSSSFYDVGDRKQQLPLFALNPQLVNMRAYWWLSAVVSTTAFAFANSRGYADYGYAGYSHGVRPLLVFR